MGMVCDVICDFLRFCDVICDELDFEPIPYVFRSLVDHKNDMTSHTDVMTLDMMTYVMLHQKRTKMSFL